MVDVIDGKLAQIHAEQRGAGEGVPRPADHSAIVSLQHYVIQQLGAELAPGYVDFLAEANGLDFNGTVLYAADSLGSEQSRDILEFRKLNDIFREGGERSHVIYGETGDELFVHDISTDDWQILDRGSLSPVESFSSFESLLDRILSRALET